MLAALGMLRGAPARFEDRRDVSFGGVLCALPALGYFLTVLLYACGSRQQPAAFIRVQVVPLTTRVDRVYPSEALVKVRGKKHKPMADQLTTVSKSRLQKRVGRWSETDMRAVEQAIKVQMEFA